MTIPDQSQPWIVNASMDYYGDLPKGAGLRYTLTDMKNNTICSGNLSDVNSTGSTITGQTMVPDGAVDLWWPNGMGEQNLYYIAIEVVSPSTGTIASVSKRVGFRTIVLNEVGPWSSKGFLYAYTITVSYLRSPTCPGYRRRQQLAF